MNMQASESFLDLFIATRNVVLRSEFLLDGIKALMLAQLFVAVAQRDAAHVAKSKNTKSYQPCARIPDVCHH